jgi:uncharacterized phage protein (TIGR01671 family)
MKREIKFRGLPIDSTKWVYGDLIHTTKDFNPVHIILNWKIYEPKQEVIIESVGQFTGLKDKNGVEIYEGDNLKVFENCNGEIKTWVNEVVFRHGSWCLVDKECCDHCKNGFGITCTFMEIPSDEIEVIGNIHES